MPRPGRLLAVVAGAAGLVGLAVFAAGVAGVVARPPPCPASWLPPPISWLPVPGLVAKRAPPTGPMGAGPQTGPEIVPADVAADFRLSCIAV
ncbi:hypothetical protein AB0D31_32685, partial [Streptomyces sp. NPDC048361]